MKKSAAILIDLQNGFVGEDSPLDSPDVRETHRQMRRAAHNGFRQRG
jgi:nicotinamidase-related amidase